jgi:hypothetical protein
MTPWKLSFYSPQPGIRPMRDWYELQNDEVRAEFDLGMDIFRSHKEWSDANGVRALTDKYSGLHEIMITFRTEDEDDDDEQSFGAIGKWKADSNEFVIFNVCDRYSDGYFQCLDRALEFAQAWESNHPRGDVYAYDME